MKVILFGTTNKAKIEQVRGVLATVNIEVRGVDKGKLPDVAEDGKTAVENARKKAKAYAKALGVTVFSMDNGLYIEGLQAEKQPGLNVRRMSGYPDRPTDGQMLEYYSKLIKDMGGRVKGYWEFGLCVATPDGITWETTIKSWRTFVSEPCGRMVEGYPLESIQIEPESGMYIAEMTQEEQDVFWQKAIGEPLVIFFQSIDL